MRCSDDIFRFVRLNVSVPFFFIVPATTEIYTLSLHDALPIFGRELRLAFPNLLILAHAVELLPAEDRKSTRLNSSHVAISYAVFCLKKKKMLIARRTNYNYSTLSLPHRYDHRSIWFDSAEYSS